MDGLAGAASAGWARPESPKRLQPRVAVADAGDDSVRTAGWLPRVSPKRCHPAPVEGGVGCAKPLR